MDRLKVAAAVIALLPGCAVATTPVLFPPGEQLTKSSVVVIAVPRAISCRVTSTNVESGLVMANAKVTWQVLVRWKGAFRVGDTFTSNESIASADKQPCDYSYNKPLLLYLTGKPPFKEVWPYDPQESVDRLKELDAYLSRHGT